MTGAEDLLLDKRSATVVPDEGREDGLEDAVSAIVREFFLWHHTTYNLPHYDVYPFGYLDLPS